MIDETSFASDVADELGLTSSAYAGGVASAVDLDNTAFGEDVATAINEGGEPTLTVCQYNIGHFNMGMKAGDVCLIGSSAQEAQDYPQFFDYDTQLGLWKSRISGIGADIIGMPEWNDNFGYNGGGSLVKAKDSQGGTDSEIFDGYNVSVGESYVSGWWINALASTFVMSNVTEVEVAHLSGANTPHVLEATVTIEGKQVVIAVTHLNWNQSQIFHDSRVDYEIPFLVNRYKDLPYVILLGDFNTQGTYGGAKSPDNKTGLAEFQPFITAGFTLANSEARPLLTCNATGSRPDRPEEPNYPFCYLDNIIVKGFTMSRVTVIDDGSLTDHCAIYCGLTMTEEGGE